MPFHVGLDIVAGLQGRSVLSWRDAGWSVLSAFILFIALRTGFTAIAFAGAALSLWAWAASRRSYRQIADIPIAKLASAPQGMVGLTGLGESLPDYPVRSPLTGLPCLWFDYKVEQGHGKSRRVVQQGRSELPFALRDGGQLAIVLPENARIISRHHQRWRRGDETCTESVLLDNEPLFVLGEYVHDWVEGNQHSFEKQAGALLQEWKHDQASLKSRFDSDNNGVIDMQEWEQARAQAQRDVLTGQHMPQTLSQQCLRKPRLGGPFIISNYSAKQLSSRFRRWSWLHMGIFCAALLVAVW
jgi:hypothetical protein